MNNNKLKEIAKLALFILIPLIVGGISALLTKNSMSEFKNLNQPNLSPPAWLFPVAWTILYILMGISSYLIYKNKNVFFYKERDNYLILYIIQLIFNFFWSIIFFNMKMYYFAFIWLIILWILILSLIINAKKVNKIAYYLLIPYIIWVTFAGYLNIMIAILN